MTREEINKQRAELKLALHKLSKAEVDAIYQLFDLEGEEYRALVSETKHALKVQEKTGELAKKLSERVKVLEKQVRDLRIRLDKAVGV